MRAALRGVGWFAREFPLWLLTSVRDIAVAAVGVVSVTLAVLVCWGAVVAAVGVVCVILFRP